MVRERHATHVYNNLLLNTDIFHGDQPPEGDGEFSRYS